MRRIIHIITVVFGAFAGFGGIEHGYFEILQGSGRPNGLMIESIGPPCIPAEVWHACEPAMTIIPNFLITGIVALILGVTTMAWSIMFMRRQHGGLILALLSFALLLFGGGIVPPIIGFIGGLMAIKLSHSRIAS